MNLATIIREAKEGNDMACQLLISAMKAPMMVVCRRYFKDSRDAEERMLDGFYKCLTNLAHFNYESEDKFSAWLQRIMIRECLMYLRKQQLVLWLTESDQDDIAIEPEVISKLSAADIFQMVDELPTGYRTVFSLNVIEGIEHKDIAGLLGIKEITSRTQLAKAKTFLQKKLILNGFHHGRDRSILD